MRARVSAASIEACVRHSLATSAALALRALLLAQCSAEDTCGTCIQIHTLAMGEPIRAVCLVLVYACCKQDVFVTPLGVQLGRGFLVPEDSPEPAPPL